jgi:AcrR family transcriptional regulator
MLSNLTFTVSGKTCLKNPVESELGRRMLSESILLMDEIGLEHFTFRKLAQRMGSAEATIYRYFENKHKLLLYLVNWYWGWLENKIIISTHSLNSSYQKLETAIELLASPIEQDDSIEYINQLKLYHIIIAEGPKAYLIKEIDEENKEGLFLSYKGLCAIIAGFILNINPKYKHSHTLASTIIETCHNQVFFSQHLPRLTDVEEDNHEMLKDFVLHLTASTIQ